MHLRRRIRKQVRLQSRHRRQNQSQRYVTSSQLQIKPGPIMSANKRFNKLKRPKQDEIRVQVRRPSKGAQEAGDETSSKQPAARKPTPAAQGGVTNPGISNSKPPAKRKRPTPVPDDDDSVPTDSSDDGKQLTLIKLKRTIKRHARWCPFVRLNRKIRNSHRRIEAMIASLTVMVTVKTTRSHCQQPRDGGRRSRIRSLSPSSQETMTMKTTAKTRTRTVMMTSKLRGRRLRQHPGSLKILNPRNLRTKAS